MSLHVYTAALPIYGGTDSFCEIFVSVSTIPPAIFNSKCLLLLKYPLQISFSDTSNLKRGGYSLCSVS